MNIRQQGIIRAESGIIDKQGIYFHNASVFAQQHLFYALWGAKYVCDKPYQVDREGLNAFLLFFIQMGELHFSYRGKTFTAKANDVVLIDCNYPHRYFAESQVHFLWFHFHGAASSAYCNLLWQNGGGHFSGLFGLEQDFQSILSMLPMSAAADDRISYTIHHLLSLLNTQGHSSRTTSPQILQAMDYMRTHFNEDISIGAVAQQVSMSRYYFSRRFLNESGMTPHNFLLETRLSYAKTRLSESNDSIEQIALDCAFYSSSNFIRAFKKHTGMTPLHFRHIIDTTS